MNLAAINGSWQSVTFLNFYMAENGRDTTLPCDIILYEMNEEMETVCSEILRNFSFIRNIFTIKDFSTEKYNYLWIGKLFSAQSKKIANNYKQSRIIIFEEGLHSYIEPKRFSIFNFVKDKSSFRYKLAVTLRLLGGKNILISNNEYSHLMFLEHEKKIIKKYFLLPLVEEDHTKIVCSDHLKFIISKIMYLQKQVLQHSDKPMVLIVGQCFCNYNLVDYEVELGYYQLLIKTYLNNGYHVVWKGHPRAKTFDQKIREKFKEIQVLDDNPLPLELLTFNNGKIELSGVSSSSLLYNKYLLKNKTTQIAYLITEKLETRNIWHSDFYLMFKLIENTVDRIELKFDIYE